MGLLEKTKKYRINILILEGDINKIRDEVNEIRTIMKDDLPQEENNEQELKIWYEEGERHDIIEKLHN